MSFALELEKVGSIDEAQLLFEKEVARLGTLDVYRSSEVRYIRRIERVQSDIYEHLNKFGIQGVLVLYQDMLLSEFIDDFSIVEVVDDQLGELERDKRFFRLLFFGIFVWILGLYK